MTTPTQNFMPESQKERWIKYGANVALVSIVVILLAGAVAYLAQRFDRRLDTTAAGLYSLKPQTVNLIRDNKQKIKLVSLYAAKDERQRDNPYAGPVRDLLEEYARKGKNIEFQAIDPVTQPTDALLGDAIKKYGGAVENYKKFIQDFGTQGGTFDELKKLTGAEAAALAGMAGDNLGESASEIVSTVRDAIPEYLTQIKDRLDRSVKVQFPDYKAIVDRLKGTNSIDRSNLDSISQIEEQLSKLGEKVKDNAQIPETIRRYLVESADRHEAIRKLVDETMKKMDSLGELKVSDLQQAMKETNLILVLGETDWRVINPSQVWKTDTRDVRAFTEGQEIKPRFAGEQAVTTAILSITNNTKPKVVFVRPGGRPLTNPGFPPFQQGGPFSEIAARLRDYNFDVLEKDLSGMWAMQSQMQGQPAAPEPSDDDIKDAVWVVLDIPSQSPMGGPPPSIAPKVAEHLRNGGSAMILSLPEGDNLSDALKEYGIEMSTDVTLVHEALDPERARSGDVSEDVQRAPVVFVVNKYGDHVLTGPLKSLDSVAARAIPVKLNPINGVKQTALLPVPASLNVWGERNTQSIDDGDPKFDKEGPNPDMPPPFWIGAAAEKDKSRLLVIGNLVGFTNQVLNWPDAEMLKRRVLVSRFPGNGELFNNGIFWLNRMEPMIAISPAAMEVSRIADMGDVALGFWRVGVLLIFLPGLILAAGIWMYFARRD